MKKVFALLLFVSFLATSCQSEYERQMKSALIYKTRLLQETNFGSSVDVETINAKISFCAELSGSREMFMKDLESRF